MLNAIDKEYQVVRLSRLNLGDVARLHKAVYGKGVEEDYFHKKYNTAYTGIENVGFIAYAADKQPVAYYGVIPCFLEFAGECMLAAQSADTMTDPRYRYKGMFVELSNMTFDLCRQLGIRLVFGFPNQNSFHGAIHKLGWKMTGPMTCFTIAVKSLPLERVSKRMKWFEDLYKKYSRFVLEKRTVPLKGVRNSVIVDGFAGVYRDEEYFGYKSYSETKVIRAGDAKIWINTKHGLVIGDMEGVEAANFAAVMHQVKKIAKKLGVKQIQFHCSSGTALYGFFMMYYQPIPSYPMLFQDFGSPVAPEKIRFTFADIDIF